MKRLVCMSLMLAAGSACKKAAPPANPEFSDALTYAFSVFDGSEADLAYALRSLEKQVYLNMDVEASSSLERALSPEHLSEEHVAGIEHPGRNLQDAIPTAVAAASAFPVDDHIQIAMLTDHTPVEPYSPDYFVRSFLEGEDCWPDRSCDGMSTSNDLIKDNFLLTIPYVFLKDYRWVDLNLPDPVSVPEGEVATNSGEPRWAYAARSWTTESFSGDAGANWIHQSFTLELWLPRDGTGFLREDGGSDSSGGGTLRLLSLWSETELGGLSNVSDDTIAGTTRVGIDDNFDAQEEYLEEH